MRLIFSIAIAAIFAIGLAVIYFARLQVAGPSDNFALTDEPYGVAFQLIDQNGNAIDQSALQGKPSALFFGFTHCPEICPTTLYELEGWLSAVDPDGTKLNAFFVTIDPERDTPEILGDYITSVTKRVTGISGDPDAVREMARGFNVYFKRVELDDGDYTMDHTASVFLLDSKGRFRKTIAYGENSDTAIQKLKDLSAL